MCRETLFTHRKLRRLAQALGGDEVRAVGHLEFLWAAANASGDPVVGDEIDVEAAAHWRGEAGVLAKALLEAGGPGGAGFIERVDGNGLFQIHDYFDHAPRHVARRAEREHARRMAGRTLSDIRREAASIRHTAATESDANGRPFAEKTEQTASKRPANGQQTAPLPTPYSLLPTPYSHTPLPPAGGGGGESAIPNLLESVGGLNGKATVARWAAKAKRPAGVTPRDLEASIVRCLRELRQSPVTPSRCNTVASTVLSLWRALGHPDVHLFADELVLVARAAQFCGDKIFARDIRAEGWKDGIDRTFQVDTVCRHDRWDDRLRVAQAWAEASGRVGPGGVAVCKRERWMDPTNPRSWQGLAEPLTMHRAYLGCARLLFEAELAGEPLEAALGKLASHEGRTGTGADLDALVRLALDEVGLW